MKYLITGANGYIGSHIVKVLLDHGHEVHVADVDYSNVDERAIRTKENIFSGAEDIYQRFGEPEVCIHLAWRNGFVHNADSHIMELPQHYLFVKNMIAGGLKHLVVMGSMKSDTGKAPLMKIRRQIQNPCMALQKILCVRSVQRLQKIQASVSSGFVGFIFSETI